MLRCPLESQTACLTVSRFISDLQQHGLALSCGWTHYIHGIGGGMHSMMPLYAHAMNPAAIIVNKIPLHHHHAKAFTTGPLPWGASKSQC